MAFSAALLLRLEYIPTASPTQPDPFSFSRSSAFGGGAASVSSTCIKVLSLVRCRLLAPEYVSSAEAIANLSVLGCSCLYFSFAKYTHEAPTLGSFVASQFPPMIMAMA